MSTTERQGTSEITISVSRHHWRFGLAAEVMVNGRYVLPSVLFVAGIPLSRSMIIQIYTFPQTLPDSDHHDRYAEHSPARSCRTKRLMRIGGYMSLTLNVPHALIQAQKMELCSHPL